MNTSQAILVRFCGPTNCRGSRYIARCAAGRLAVQQDDDIGPAENAYRAAIKLAMRLGWINPCPTCRHVPNGKPYVFYGTPHPCTEAAVSATPHAFGTLPNGDYVLTFGQASDYASPPAK